MSEIGEMPPRQPDQISPPSSENGAPPELSDAATLKAMQIGWARAALDASRASSEDPRRVEEYEKGTADLETQFEKLRHAA